MCECYMSTLCPLTARRVLLNLHQLTVAAAFTVKRSPRIARCGKGEKVAMPLANAD